jgi:hypothetical protein
MGHGKWEDEGDEEDEGDYINNQCPMPNVSIVNNLVANVIE